MIVEFNLRLALETEQLRLDPALVQAGVTALLADLAKGVYYVAECGGKVVGQVMLTYEWSDWRNGNLWWLQSVYVEEAHRQQGVFRALFKFVESAARRQRDVRGLRLYMHGENTRARCSYEKLGMHHTPYEVFDMPL